MNYNWNNTNNKGQLNTGFVDTYELDTKKCILIVNYLPQFNIDKHIVMVTILLEGKKENWSEGKIQNILQDGGDYVKNNKHNYSVDFLNTQLFYLESLTSFSYLNHGDYSII